MEELQLCARCRRPHHHDDHRSLTAPRLAGMCGVALGTIHNWAKKRHMPHSRTLGGQLRFDAEEVARYFEERGRKVPAPLLRILPEDRIPVRPRKGLKKPDPKRLGPHRAPEELLEAAEVS